MPTRRQEKMARVVKEVVSDAVANHLSDPRIEGFVSVTRVEMASDLRSTDVYLSIFGTGTVTQENDEARTGRDDSVRNKTFAAIVHAKNRIQSLLAAKLQCKFCPVLCFHLDEQFKKTLETMKLIDQATSELKEKDSAEQRQD
jgi:ribosome-binding factor A